MRIPRIYTPQALDVHSEFELEAEAAHHLVKVLRMDVGRELILFNGNGNQYSATITRTTKKTAFVSILSQEHKPNSSPVQIELAIGISKGDRFDWVLQKATELGVSRITPLFTSRCEIKLSGERLSKKMTGWQKTVIGACEQCQRNELPKLAEPLNIDDFVSQAAAELKFVLHHRSEHSLSNDTPPQSVVILVGPEGGLSDEEIQSAESNGFTPLKLGNRVLRTETAPVAALSVMQYLWGDLNSL